MKIWNGGIEIHLNDERGQEMEPTEDGFVGFCGKLPSFTLMVSVKPTAKAWEISQVHAGKSKIEVNKHDLKTLPSKWKQAKVEIRMIEHSGTHTVPGENDIRIACLDLDMSVFYVQISLVVQEDRMFLVIQEKGRGQFYMNDKGEPECIGLRPELTDLLAPEIEGKVLDPMPAKTENSAEAEPPNGPNTAVVDWYDECRQKGALYTHNGDSLAVHWTQCPEQTETGRRFLKKGQLVKYSGTSPVRDKRSSFREEAVGVEILS